MQKFIFVQLTNKYYYKLNKIFVITTKIIIMNKQFQKLHLYYKNNVINNQKFALIVTRKYITKNDFFFKISSNNLIIKFFLSYSTVFLQYINIIIFIYYLISFFNAVYQQNL